MSFVFSLLCCYRVDTHPTPRALANHSSDCFLSNNTKYDPILYFPVLYSITRFILLVAIPQGQGHKANLSNVVQTVIGRAGRLKDRGVLTGRMRTGRPDEWKPERVPIAAHSCSLTTHKHERLASSHTSSSPRSFLFLHDTPEPADLSPPIPQRLFPQIHFHR